jgi:hypothetical protein
MNKVDKMLTAGATHFEIAAVLPYRVWRAIRRRIISLRGPGFEVPESGHLEDGAKRICLVSFQLQGRWLFPAGGSLERQVPCYRESHRSGYLNPWFNVVALLVHSTFTLGILSPQL